VAPDTTERVMESEIVVATLSPTLSLLHDRLHNDRFWNILDLAPPCQQRIDLFSAHHCRIFYPNLSSLHYPQEGKNEGGHSFEELLENLFIFPDEQQLNLILADELPPNLTPQLIGVLFHFLQPRFADGLLTYLRVDARGSKKSSHLFGLNELTQALESITLLRSGLMKDGSQEILFEYHHKKQKLKNQSPPTGIRLPVVARGQDRH